MDPTQIDWDRLREKFNLLEGSLNVARVPSRELVEWHRLPELTYGQVESPLADLIDNGCVLYYDDELTRQTVDGMLRATGRLPKPDGERRVRTPSEIIREGLAKQAVTHEFIEAWGQLSYYAGLSNGLVLWDQESQREFFRRINSGQSTTIVQQHWYAHWIMQNAPSLDDAARQHENVELTVLCGEIANGQVAPWPPYPKEWFGALLGKDGQDLSATLTRLKKRQLKEMIKHPLLTPAVLPPLRPEEFERIRSSAA
jgi:hypothetical protein